jgi:hypothetical protein
MIVRALLPFALALMVATGAPAHADDAAPSVPLDPALPPPPAEVRLERAKPMREKYPTLRFLRENRDFIRGRYDRLRERPVERAGDATAIDPRFLTYRELLAGLDRGADSLARAEDERGRHDLFASVTELGSLETELDQMEETLDAQRGRLAVLEKDFTAHPATEMLVVLSGLPPGTDLASVTLELEDGGAVTLPLGDAERAALRAGGMVEVLHVFVEPRAQSVRVAVAGAAWPAGDSGWLPLEPARDRLNVVRLDLSGLGPATGITGIRAATWVHDAPSLSIDG